MFEDYEKPLPDHEEDDAARRVRRFSHEEMLTCEECLRANPPTRAACLYCGAQLPVTESSASLRASMLRQPEKWEEGYNVILLKAVTDASEALVKGTASLLRLEKEAARRIFEARDALPLARVATWEQAAHVVERLRAEGLSTHVVSDSDLIRVDPSRRRARALEFTDDALVLYAAGSGESWRILWPELLLLVAGRLVTRRVEVEERPGRKESEIVDTREMMDDVLLLDVYASRHDGGYRVASDNFDFSCLGRKKEFTSARNFTRLVEELRAHATQASYDDSYQRLRQALASVWPPEERTESKGLRRDRPGRFHTEAVVTSNNEAQFTRYSRLRHYQKLREAESITE